MGDLFLGLVKLVGDLLKQSPHRLLAIQHVPGFFVAFDVVFDFLLEVLVDALVFKYTKQALVDFAVQKFVLVGQFQVLLPQILALQGGLVKLTLAVSDRSFEVLQLVSEILVFVGGGFQGLAEFLILRFALFALPVQLCDLLLKFSLFFSELLNLLVSG